MIVPASPQTEPRQPPAERTAEAELFFAVALYRLGRTLMREGVQPEAVLRELLARLVEHFRADTGSLALREEDGRWRLVCGIGLPAHVLGSFITRERGGVLLYAAECGEPLLLEGDLSHDPRFRGRIREGTPPASALCWPLKAEGETIGVLSLNRHDAARSFNEADLARGAAIVDMAALVLDNARLQRAARLRLARLDAYARIQKYLACAHSDIADGEGFYRGLLDLLADMVQVRYAAIAFFDADRRTPRTYFAHGLSAAQLSALATLPGGAALLERVLATDAPLVVADLAAEPAYADLAHGDPPLRQLLATPLRAEASGLTGVLFAAERRDGTPFGDADLRCFVLAAEDIAQTEARIALARAIASRQAELEQLAQMVELAHQTLEQHYQATVQRFAQLIEARHGLVPGHAARVAETAERLAQALGLDPVERKHLRYAALLHDIGKLTWPDALLSRPFNLLAGEERAIATGHPLAAQALLAGLEPLGEAARLIRSHHERYDGLGYPERLAADRIPLGARILALAEDYDELQQGWLVPERLDAEQAREFIRTESGRRYDPLVVKAFLDTWQPPEAVLSGERRLPWSALRPGMTLSRPLKTQSGSILLPAGTVLSPAHLERLRAIVAVCGRLQEVYVCPHPLS